MTAIEEPRKRVRRSDEQLILDLQNKIQEIQGRAEAKKAKQSPAIRLMLRAVRAIDKAMDAAESEGDTALRHVLSDGREPIANYLQEKGVRVRKSRRPKGPRPKSNDE
jgi:hypothetical protein